MKFKWVYLFLAFFLPIGLTFFLQFFGKSEFNIPVYYEKGIGADTLASECHYQYRAPYVIPDSVANKLAKGVTTAMLITIDSGSLAKKNFDRVKEELTAGEFTFVLVNQANSNSLLSCVLFLKGDWTTVLVDDHKRIRGYYNPAKREDADRLIAEMKILLKDY